MGKSIFNTFSNLLKQGKQTADQAQQQRAQQTQNTSTARLVSGGSSSSSQPQRPSSLNYSPAGTPVASSVTGGTIFQQGNRQYVVPMNPATSSQLGGGQTLGVSTYAGSGGGGGAAAPINNPNAPFESSPEMSSFDFDALIAPALEALNQAEGAANTQYTADISEIETGAQKRKTGAEEAKKSSETQLTQRKQATTTTAEGAINEARKAAAELQQGIGARYGSGVSTGLGASAILGAQSARTIGQLRANLAQALTEIETAKTGVVETYNNYLKELDAETETLKQQARATLQNNLAGIGQKRGELQARKSELAYQAMEQYRQEVNAVNQRNTVFKQQIYTRAQEAQQKLDQAQQRASQRIQSIRPFQPVTTSFGDLFSFNPNTGEYLSATPGTKAPSTTQTTTPNLLGTNPLTEEDENILSNY